MHIKVKLTEKDFINLNFVLLYHRVLIKIFTGVIIFAVLLTLLTAILVPGASYSPVFTSFLMLVVLPLVTYFSAKKSYTANSRISETIEYQFEADNLLVKGESFNAQLTWDKIYKVTQTKNWVLIWQNRQAANAIPKRDIWDGQIEDLKTILGNHQVKNNL